MIYESAGMHASLLGFSLASHFPDHIPEAVDAAIRDRFPVRLARADAASRRRGRGAGPGLAEGAGLGRRRRGTRPGWSGSCGRRAI